MKIFFLLVGAMDSSTGILLMLAPKITLQLMGIEAPLETIFLRWVGAFVFSVGLLYFLPLLKNQADRGRWRIRACLTTTTLVRANIAVFVMVAIFFFGFAHRLDQCGIDGWHPGPGTD